MEVRIKNHTLFSDQKRMSLGKDEITINIPSASVLSDIFQLLSIRDDAVSIVLINGKPAEKRSVLMNGDIIEFLPVLFGG